MASSDKPTPDNMGLSDSPILLVSIPVLFVALLVCFLFVFTAVEARKVSISKSVPGEENEEENPLEVNNSANIEEDLGEMYAPIPVEYREDILSNIKRKQSFSSPSPVDSAQAASTLLQLMVSQDSLSGEKVTDAIEVIQAEEAGDQLDEARSTSWPPINALRRRRKTSRIGSLQMIREKKINEIS